MTAPDSFHALNTGCDDDVGGQYKPFMLQLIDGAHERGAGGERGREATSEGVAS